MDYDDLMRDMRSFWSLVSLIVIGCAAPGEDAPAADVAPAEEPPAEAAPVAESAELLPNAVSPEEGLLAGGQPSVEQLEALKEAGYVSVINLRTDGEGGTGQAEVEELGLTYLALPITGAEGLSEENARAFAALLEEAERPAVVHCGSGNRVGALFALKAFYVDGASAEEALAYGRQSGLTRLEGAVEEHLAAATAETGG